jgi:hypothetical protein
LLSLQSPRSAIRPVDYSTAIGAKARVEFLRLRRRQGIGGGQFRLYDYDDAGRGFRAKLSL